MVRKSILMVIAYKDFRDEEYFKTRQVFENAGAKIKVASNKIGEAIGAEGNTVETEILIKEARPEDYDAVVFIGGSGALTYIDNEDSYKLAEETIYNKKILAAICISPVILAKAGVLEGKKATVWTSPTDKSAVKILEENGAEFSDQPAVADGTIITGSGPGASKEFAMKVVEVLI
jgi:protease I